MGDDSTWREIVRSAPDYITVLDEQLVIQYVNLAATGLSVERLVGTCILDPLPPGEAARVEPLLRGVLETGRSNTHGTRYEHPGGDGVTWFETHTVRRCSGGKTIGLTLYSRDVTAAKQDREDLEARLAQEALLGRVSAGLAVLSFDQIDAGIERALEAIARHTNTVRSSVFIFSDDLSTVTNTHEWCTDRADSQIAQLQSIPAESFGYYMQRLRRHDNVVISSLDDLPVEEAAGERQWAEQHGFRPLLFVPMVSAGGLHGALGFYGAVGPSRRWSEGLIALLRLVADTVLHMVERQQAELARQESQQRFRSLIEGSTDFTLILDDQSIVRYVSPSIVAATGFASDALLGGQPSDFIHPEDLPSHEQALERAVRSPGRLVPLEGFRVRTRAGGWIDVEGSYRCDFDQPGVRGIVFNGRDITEQLKAAATRRRLEAQMQQAQKLESLSVLAGGVAHDFNNLLMGIMGNADLALQDLSPEAPAYDNLQDIGIAADRAADLARQMLAYSGKGRFEVQRISLSTLVEEMVHLLEASISKKVVLKLEIAPEVAPISADATQLRQIVMNLVLNASEAVGDSGGSISVRTGVMDCDQAYLDSTFLDQELAVGSYSYVEISDTGGGMDRETLARIFDPFFTTKFTGRGLGLAAVLGIVRGHQGAIKVSSEPGRGTTFKVLIPACEGDPPAPALSELPPEVSFSGKVVLLVDDEETVLSVASRMLEHLGFEVVMAEDGRQALEVFQRDPERIDVVLLDLTMPRVDGEQCFRELRKLWPDVIVVLSSGYNEQDLIDRFAGEGMAGFIQKPYVLSKLRDRLVAVLGD
jgi:PAS domain S-box-containing protein